MTNEQRHEVIQQMLYEWKRMTNDAQEHLCCTTGTITLFEDAVRKFNIPNNEATQEDCDYCMNEFDKSAWEEQKYTNSQMYEFLQERKCANGCDIILDWDEMLLTNTEWIEDIIIAYKHLNEDLIKQCDIDTAINNEKTVIIPLEQLRVKICMEAYQYRVGINDYFERLSKAYDKMSNMTTDSIIFALWRILQELITAGNGDISFSEDNIGINITNNSIDIVDIEEDKSIITFYVR